jgi:hypothetical protein
MAQPDGRWIDTVLYKIHFEGEMIEKSITGLTSLGSPTNADEGVVACFGWATHILGVLKCDCEERMKKCGSKVRVREAEINKPDTEDNAPHMKRDEVS